MKKDIKREIESWLKELPILAELSDLNYHQDCVNIIFKAKEIFDEILGNKETEK